MADYELIGLNEAAPDLRAPTAADRGIIAGGVRAGGLSELDGGADINGSRVTTVADTNPLRQAVRVAMTAAASGSNGIQVLSNTQLAFGTTTPMTLHWEGALPDYTPSATARLCYKYQTASIRWTFNVLTSGALSVFAEDGVNTISAKDSTVLLQTVLTDGQFAKLTAVIVRETASVAGSVTFYVNGVQLGAVVVIPAATPTNLTNTGSFYISGSEAARFAADTQQAIIYNRALSAAEVLSLCVNGPALADIGASQTPVYTSDFSAGVDGWTTGGVATVAGNVDGINGQDDWASLTKGAGTDVMSAQKTVTILSGSKRTLMRLFNPSGSPITHVRVAIITDIIGTTTNAVIAVPANTQVDAVLNFQSVVNGIVAVVPCDSAGNAAAVGAGTVIYFKNVVHLKTGITGQWNAENAQSNTGQIFDSSGNKKHALLPAAGATIIGKESAQLRQVRWTNTWAGTNELQYIGGVNQAILPANAYIESIIGTVSGATPHDIIIGDGSDTDRYVTITTGLAAGTTSFTLANRTTDGTNLKLTVDPDTDATMSIAWVISYRILE
jgi:hypothetical protein